jgi:hypothetical protein
MASQRSNIVIPMGNASSSDRSSTISNNNSNGPPPSLRSSSSSSILNQQVVQPIMISSIHALNVARGSSNFNPQLIISQIVCLQCYYYIALGLIFQCNYILFGLGSITLDRLFTDTYLNIWSAAGWVDNGAVLSASIVGAILLTIIVEKSKKCLDFSITLFVLHLVVCTVYTGGNVPSTWDWWIIHFIGMIIMVLFGEYLCSKKELSDIPLLAM